LPTLEELETLNNEQNAINQHYFPHLNIQYCGWYCSSNRDSEGNIALLSFDTGRRGASENGLSHVLLMRKASSDVQLN